MSYTRGELAEMVRECAQQLREYSPLAVEDSGDSELPPHLRLHLAYLTSGEERAVNTMLDNGGFPGFFLDYGQPGDCDDRRAAMCLCMRTMCEMDTRLCEDCAQWHGGQSSMLYSLSCILMNARNHGKAQYAISRGIVLQAMDELKNVKDQSARNLYKALRNSL